MIRFAFEELDHSTREFMLEEFEREENSGRPYRGNVLSADGIEVFPDLMRQAIEEGGEATLYQALRNYSYWKPFDSRGRRVNQVAAAERLAITEFNTWYVRGLASRLINEGNDQCQSYRAAPAVRPRSECLAHENRLVDVYLVYKGHRARYWPPESADRSVFSIPAGPSCHHSIRRVS